jgi:HTH-type transcriptional regulator, sugar sensing transcriptional regulator
MGARKTKDLLPALAAVGFSLNESRAYAALLRESPATGYEVGVRAEVPRSAVYGVLRRLVDSGAARSIAGSPERFVPVALEDLLSLLRTRFETSATALEHAVRDLDVEPPAPDAFSVRGYARILEEAGRLIRSAHGQVVVSGWPRELAVLSGELGRAHTRGVHLAIFSHAALPELPGDVFTYGLAEAALEEFWKHRLIVVADDVRTLIAAAERGDDDQAVVTETPAIAEVATSQVALDITLLSQREGRDVSEVMARMLGARVGRLDTLLAARRK